MALRFTDTEIWNKDWFLDLEPKQKLLTYFLYANCDCAGFYEISWSKIKFFFAGTEITKADFLKIKSLIFISDDVIFLQDFILEQQKIKSLNKLNLSNNAHKGILKRIDFYNKIYNFSPLLKGLGVGVIGNMVEGNKVEGKTNNQITNKEERETNKEKEESFENSNSEKNEINETKTSYSEIPESLKQPLKFADLPENLRVCGKNEGVFKPPKLEEIKDYCLNERQNTIDYEQFYDFYTSKGWYIGKNKMKDWRAAVRTWEKGSNKTQKQKTTDPPCNRPEFEDYYRLYEELCPNLPRLRFERRNAQIRELLARFIDEIDDDVGYFKSLCEKANKLKKICESQIDFKMLINNHIGIFNGRYENDIFDITEYFKNNNGA